LKAGGKKKKKKISKGRNGNEEEAARKPQEDHLKRRGRGVGKMTTEGGAKNLSPGEFQKIQGPKIRE